MKPESRIFDACGIGAVFNTDGKPVSGKVISDMMSVMRERENGLGGGFAAYGIFPKNKEQYCIQLLLEDSPDLKAPAKERVEEYLKDNVEIVKDEKVQVRKTKAIREHPLIWRFFVNPKTDERDLTPDERIKNIVMHINAEIDGAFCMSSGKNMAVFKGNGWVTDISEFYGIREMDAFMWTGHSRFPTNTPGWWGGAHPFNILGHSVVHNGEITSYGTNVNYLKELGYLCTLLTDTEVLAYLFDYLARKCNYPPQIAQYIACATLAPPYWRDIDRMNPVLKNWYTMIRITHRKAMANGPFSIVITTDYPKPTMIGHSDRKKLRPLIAALSGKEDTFYLSSELNAIHYVDKTENFWQPNPGNAVIASLGEGVVSKGFEDPLRKMKLKIAGDAQ